jgi:predicted aspartyl protease
LVISCACAASAAFATIPNFKIRQEAAVTTTSCSPGSAEIRRDSHGRPLAPVFINGKGPFSLIVDTGANGTAVSAAVVEAVGAGPERLSHMLLRGITGSGKVSAVRVDSLALGGFITPPATLPIITEALDGADGFFGTGGLSGKRVAVHFHDATVCISNSDARFPGNGYVTVAADLSRSRLVTIEARFNGIPVQTIIDTGAGDTIGNAAMQRLLMSSNRRSVRRDYIVGTTTAVAYGYTRELPALELGSVRILGARVAFSDLPIFDHFKLLNEPALLVGMDILGTLDSLIIDYGAQRVHLRTASAARTARQG